MPFPGTHVVHPAWGDTHCAVSDEAMNAVVTILKGTATDWTPATGPTVGLDNVIYAGPARVSYDLDRPFTKDNADQLTTTSVILVALPRTTTFTVLPDSGMTVKVESVDSNGLNAIAHATLRVLKARHSGLSFGVVLDCSEMVGRTNG